MMDPSPTPIADVALECKSCFAKINTDDSFCQSCGFPLKGTDAEQKIFNYRKGFKKVEIEGEIEGLQKKIKSARNTLFVLAGLFIISGFVFYFFDIFVNYKAAFAISYLAIGVIFLLLGFACAKRPLAATISGMSLYILFQILLSIQNPSNILSGLIVKIIIILYLANGIVSAMTAEKIRNQLKN